MGGRPPPRRSTGPPRRLCNRPIASTVDPLLPHAAMLRVVDPLLERTVRLPSGSGRDQKGSLMTTGTVKKVDRRTRLRLHRRRRWEGILLPSRRPPGLPRLRPPCRRRARLVRDRSQSQGPARHTGRAPPSSVEASAGRGRGRHAAGRHPPTAACPGRRAHPAPAPGRIALRSRGGDPRQELRRLQNRLRLHLRTAPMRHRDLHLRSGHDGRGARDRRPSPGRASPAPYPAEVHHRIRRDVQADYGVRCPGAQRLRRGRRLDPARARHLGR